MNKLIEDAYKIADKNAVILKGNIKISGDVNCLLFAHYCDSTLFYKRFFKISKDVLKVNKIARKNLKEIKKLLKSYGYNELYDKDLRDVIIMKYIYDFFINKDFNSDRKAIVELNDKLNDNELEIIANKREDKEKS